MIEFIFYLMIFFGLYFAIFFIYTFFEKRNEIFETAKKPKKYYSVTIIVPAFNEEKSILKTLNSLVSLNYPKDKLLIMVIDDGSTDRTFDIVKKANIPGISLYKKKNGGKYTALNFALSKIKSELVGALDADSFADSDALVRMVSYFDDNDVMAVTPSMRIFAPKGILQRVQAMEYLFGLFTRKIFSVLSSEHITPGPFTILRKSFFDKFGGYKRAHNTEDIEVALRVQSNGFKIKHARNAAVYTIGPDKFSVLFKQRLRWYNGFIKNVLDYKKLFSPKYGLLGVFILPLSFISIFLVILGLIVFLYGMIFSLYDFIVKISVGAFTLSEFFSFGKFDLFYFRFDSIAILSLISFILGIFMIIMAKKISKEKLSIPINYFLFLNLYWILFSVWWIVSVFYSLFNIRTRWWHKSGK